MRRSPCRRRRSASSPISVRRSSCRGCRARIGFYLGLTGARVTGADAVHAGLATHFTPRAQLAGTVARAGRGWCRRAGGVRRRRCRRSPWRPSVRRSIIASRRATVARSCARLAATDATGRSGRCKALRGVSPSALYWTLEALHRGARPDAAAGARCRVRADPHHDASSRLRRGRARHGGGQGPPAALAAGARSRMSIRQRSQRCSGERGRIPALLRARDLRARARTVATLARTADAG